MAVLRIIHNGSRDRLWRPQTAEVFRILCYGDSNTDGPKEGGWPEALHTLESKDASGSSLRSRQRRGGGILIPSRPASFSAGSTDYQPDLVIVSFGWNDVAWR